MFAKIFDTATVDEFADWVVAEVKRSLPASFDPSLKNVSEKVDRLDKKIAERTDAFTRASKLNIFKKARLASRVQEGMAEMGYPKPFIKSFSLDLIRRVVAASRKT